MYLKTNLKTKIISILLVLAAVGAAVGAFVYAKYVFTGDSDKQDVTAAAFHISSDYLEDPTKNETHSVFAPQDGIRFTLNNYEKENAALISEVEIAYSVKVEVNGVECTDRFTLTNQTASATGFSGTLPKSSERITHQFFLEPTELGLSELEVGDSCRVTVTTTSPYTKTLSATFVFQNKPVAEASLLRVDANAYGDRYELTLKTNAYAKDLTVTWDTELIPDNTNELMKNWADGSEVLTVKAYTAYSLIFFNPTHQAFTVTFNEEAKELVISPAS